MLNFKSCLVALAVVNAFANALPSHEQAQENTKRNTCYTYVDTFDNYTASIVAPEASPINYYGGLFYYFDAAPSVPGFGVIPASSPNFAAASVNQDLAKLGVVTLNPFGVITTRGTATKYFTLVEFYYACLVFTNGVPVPTGCGIDVYGYDIYGKRVGSAAYNFAPTNQVVVPMDRAILPLYYSFLKNVTIAISTATVATTGTVLYIDNVTHINCY